MTDTKRAYVTVRLYLATGRWQQVMEQARTRGLDVSDYLSELIDAALAEDRCARREASVYASSLADAEECRDRY